MYICINGWKDVWMDRQKDDWMDGREEMNSCKRNRWKGR